MPTSFRKPLALAAAGALALLIQACASPSISKNECVGADWYAIGYETAILGKREAEISNYRKACAEHGVTPDLARFLEGRAAGLERFCEPRNGYRLGRAGNNYAGICPQRLESEFLRGYNAGRELYQVQRDIRRLDHRIDAKQSELDRVRNEVNERQTELIAPATMPTRRVAVLGEVVELRQKMQNIETDIRDARMERERASARYSELQRLHAGW